MAIRHMGLKKFITPNNVPLHVDSALWERVSATMPMSVQREFSKRRSRTVFPTDRAIKEWLVWQSKDKIRKHKHISYANSAAGRRTFLKDAMKHYFYKHYGWRRIGHANYMTGDTTGVSLALQSNPKLSVKLITGKKSATDDKRWIDKRAENQKLQANRAGRDCVYLSELAANQVIRSNSDLKGKTTAVDALRFHGSQRHANARCVRKPWNLHVTEATRQTRTFLKQHWFSHDAIVKRFDVLTVYEKYQIGNLFKCLVPDGALVIWGRRSGHNGGAHKELDSDPTAWSQLITHFRQALPEKPIVLLGDPVNLDGLDSNLRDTISEVNRFWDLPDLSGGMKTLLAMPVAQEYFRSLFLENNNVVVGMRSGILELGAALGVRTIYIDNHACTRHGAGRRMEQLAGSAATSRKRRRESGALNTDFEQSKEGVARGYKRVVTSSDLGRTQDYKTHLIKWQQRLDEIVDSLNQGVITGLNDKKVGRLLSLIKQIKNRVRWVNKERANQQIELKMNQLLGILTLDRIDQTACVDSADIANVKSQIIAGLHHIQDAKRAVWNDNEMAQLDCIIFAYSSDCDAHTLDGLKKIQKQVQQYQRYVDRLRDNAYATKVESFRAFIESILNQSIEPTSVVLRKELLSLKPKLHDWGQQLGFTNVELNELSLVAKYLFNDIYFDLYDLSKQVMSLDLDGFEDRLAFMVFNDALTPEMLAQLAELSADSDLSGDSDELMTDYDSIDSDSTIDSYELMTDSDDDGQ